MPALPRPGLCDRDRDRDLYGRGFRLACSRRHDYRGGSPPFLRTLDTFDWTYPSSINRSQIQNLFHLRFLAEHGNVIYVGETGVGKTHLAIALAHHACVNGHRVLYTTAIDIVNHLAAARQTNCFARELQKFIRPPLMCID